MECRINIFSICVFYALCSFTDRVPRVAGHCLTVVKCKFRRMFNLIGWLYIKSVEGGNLQI